MHPDGNEKNIKIELGTQEAVLSHFLAAATRVGLPNPEKYIKDTAGIPALNLPPGKEIDWSAVAFSLSGIPHTHSRNAVGEFYRDFFSPYPHGDELATFMDRLNIAPCFRVYGPVSEDQNSAHWQIVGAQEDAEDCIAILQRQYDMERDLQVKIVSSLDEISGWRSTSSLCMLEAGELLHDRMKQVMGEHATDALVGIAIGAGKIHVLGELVAAPDDVFHDAMAQIRRVEKVRRATSGTETRDLLTALLKNAAEVHDWAAASALGNNAAYHVLYLAGQEIFARDGKTEDPFIKIINLAYERGTFLMGVYENPQTDEDTLVFRMLSAGALPE
ncbi:hypothetical protein HY732_01945 [Candidatus Uhrbacteria bacterium]|nr:hypothetical protein [Candidatus Uhrbacteria bacterium]